MLPCTNHVINDRSLAFDQFIEELELSLSLWQQTRSYYDWPSKTGPMPELTAGLQQDLITIVTEFDRRQALFPDSTSSSV